MAQQEEKQQKERKEEEEQKTSNKASEIGNCDGDYCTGDNCLSICCALDKKVSNYNSNSSISNSIVWPDYIKNFKKLKCRTCQATSRALVSIDYGLPIDEGHWRAIFYHLDNLDIVVLKKQLSTIWRSTNIGACLIKRIVGKYFTTTTTAKDAQIFRQLLCLEFPRHLVQIHVDLFCKNNNSSKNSISNSNHNCRRRRRHTLNDVDMTHYCNINNSIKTMMSWLPSFLIHNQKDVFSNSLTDVLEKLKCDNGDVNSTINFARQPLYRLTQKSDTLRVLTETRVFYLNRIYFYLKNHVTNLGVFVASSSSSSCSLRQRINCAYYYSNSLIFNQFVFKSKLKQYRKNFVILEE